MNNRRDFIKSLGMVGVTGSLLSSPIALLSNNNYTKPNLKKLPPVQVSEDRIIRQVVGHRPFRPSGFNLQKQKMDNKIIIHNYGHGGGGISLSWGTSTLAVEMVETAPGAEIAVLGCGVIGLSTAILLQRKGHEVTIYSKDLPPNTTSNVAGALWAPVSVFDSKSTDQSFMTQFERASAISHRMFQDLVSPRYGVWWIKNYFLGGGFDFPGGKNLYPGFKEYGKDNGLFDFPTVQELNTLMIEPPIYLNALLDDFYRAGGNIRVREFQSPKDLMNLKESVIMNCTGLGSNKLFNDTELVPVKGQLTVLLPQAEIDYSYVAPSYNNLLYMFPRKDGIILGGTSEKGNWSPDPNAAETSRIINGHSAISKFMTQP